MTEHEMAKGAAATAGGPGAETGLSQSELDALVAASDTGARGTHGPVGVFLMIAALCWSLFQLWIASPIPFMLGFGVFNDTEARAIHLAFAIFLAYAAFPATRSPVQLALGLGVPLILSLLFMVSAKEGTTIWWVVVVGLALAAAVLLGSPKGRVPVWEWVLAGIGAATSLYLFVFL